MALPKAPDAAGFIKFEKVGDGVKGKLRSFDGNGTTVKGDPCPELHIEADGEDVTVTASQIKLWILVNEMDEAGTLYINGDIEVRMTQLENRAGGKTLKHFSIVTSPAVAGAEMDSLV